MPTRFAIALIPFMTILHKCCEYALILTFPVLQSRSWLSIAWVHIVCMAVLCGIGVRTHITE